VSVEIHPAVSDRDLEHYVDVVRRVQPDTAMLVSELREIKRALELVHLIALEHAEPVGSGVIVKAPRMRARKGAFARVMVLEEHRGGGIGSSLYREISDWARARDIELLETNVREDDLDSFEWARRRGFSEVSRELRVELDVRDLDPPPVDPPAGIEIVRWVERPELACGMYEVAVEAYPDVPGYEEDEMESFEDWLAHDMGGTGDRPEATFVAIAGDAVVGYAKFSLTDAQPTIARHDLTGVKRAWRGRGIAGALKRAEIAWAKQAGYERLSTTNEQRNEPIRRLNERLGYRPTPGRVFLRGPLAPA
jgi:GNAT superfamily N-acetyltransferase